MMITGFLFVTGLIFAVSVCKAIYEGEAFGAALCSAFVAWVIACLVQLHG